MRSLQIQKITKQNQKIADEIINLVDTILDLKSKNANADINELESKIDSLIYNLYDLNADEINIIEGK